MARGRLLRCRNSAKIVLRDFNPFSYWQYINSGCKGQRIALNHFKKCYFVFNVLTHETLPRLHHPFTKHPFCHLIRFITILSAFYSLSLAVKIIRQQPSNSNRGGLSSLVIHMCVSLPNTLGVLIMRRIRRISCRNSCLGEAVVVKVLVLLLFFSVVRVWFERNFVNVVLEGENWFFY